MTTTVDRPRRFLGFTVFCDFIQSEGIDPVLDNLGDEKLATIGQSGR